MNKVYSSIVMLFITLSLAMEKPQDKVIIETDIDFYFDMLDIPLCSHISDIHAAYEIKIQNELQRHLYATSMLSEALYQILVYKNRSSDEPVKKLSIIEKKHLLNTIVYRRINELREEHKLIKSEDLKEPFFEGHEDFSLTEDNGPLQPMGAKL